MIIKNLIIQNFYALIFYYFTICCSCLTEHYIVDTFNVKVNINFKKAFQYEIYKITKLGTRIYI